MLNKIIFSDAETKLAESKLQNNTFTSESWSDDDIDNLKNELKRFI